MSAANTLDQIERARLAMVVRALSTDAARTAVDAACSGGVRVVEITFTVRDAASLIAELAQNPDLIVGAGTVLTLADARAAVAAGARFLVSPGLDEEIVRYAVELDVLMLPGVLTPSEIIRARSLGVLAVKLFPADAVGPTYLQALRGPFPDLAIMPSGGVNTENAADWIAAGAVAVGMAGSLSPASATPDTAAIAAAARRAVSAVGRLNDHSSEGQVMNTPIPLDVIEAFREISTPSVSDALQSLGVHGYVASAISRVAGGKLVGPAVTVKEEPTNESLPPQHALEAIDAAEPGAVIVIDNGGETEVACWGGLMTAGAVANGLAGVVLDAGVRDREEIERDFAGFTVFSRSLSPATTVGRFRTVASGVPVSIGGVTVNPGDLVVGDGDGVVIVPRDLVDQTLEVALDIESREREQTRLILDSGSLATGLAKYNRI